MIRRIYDRAPVTLQHAAISAAGYQRHFERYGQEYQRYRRFLEDFETWKLGERLDYQRAQLADFVQYAADRSPFYAELYAGVDLETIRSVESLVALPVVDKEMLRANIERAVTIPRRGSLEGHTGGTTGMSLVTRRTRDDNMRKIATLDHFRAKHGFVHHSMRHATFNGKHIVPAKQQGGPYWRYNAACKQMIYSPFQISENTLADYVESLNLFRPQALDGFFYSLCDVASFIERHGLKLKFTPLAIFPTSETLTPQGRALLERVFGCKVYDQYSSSEAAPFVTECVDQVLHVDLASGVFEQLEGTDEILVTSFTSHGTPLIRYRIGDQMVFAAPDERCSCGDPSPIVHEIRGRRLDYLYNADGVKVTSANVSNLFKNVPNSIIRAQAIQDRVDHVDLLLEVDETVWTDRHEEVIREEFLQKFGKDTTLAITLVEHIARESSGKFKLVVNNVAESTS